MARLPERLLVSGYRHWLAGYETGSIEPWEMAWSLYAAELGLADGRSSISAVASWVRELRQRPEGGPSFYPHSCRWLCRDECFALCTISALQHGDEATAKKSLSALLPHEHSEQARDVAECVADQFFKIGQVLQPVSAKTFAEMASQQPQARIH